MKYLKSTTQKSYLFEGKRIPPAVTKDNEVLTISDKEYTELLKVSVIKSLVNAGSIIVMDKAPTNPTAQLKDAVNRNAEQALKITQLQEEIRELKAKGGSNSTEVEELKAAIEKQKAEDLAEIQALQAEKDAEIEKLKAELKKAKKGE